MKTKPNDSANPSEPRIDFESNTTSMRLPQSGLTKREYFAAMAMQGLCACSIAGSHNMPHFLSVEAVAHADALIEALNVDKQN